MRKKDNTIKTHKTDGKNLPQKVIGTHKQKVWTYMMNRAELDLMIGEREGRLTSWS